MSFEFKLTLHLITEPEQPTVARRQSADLTATYLWDPSLINTAALRSSVVNFAKSQGVKRIYLQINQSMPLKPYQQFIIACTGNNIAVEALSGDPTWALDEFRPYLTSFLDWVAKYQQKATPTEKFQGIHLDVEVRHRGPTIVSELF